jgi:4-oxalocrotonate tautomerase
VRNYFLRVLAFTLMWAGFPLSPARPAEESIDTGTQQPTVHIPNYESTRVLRRTARHDGSTISVASQIEVPLNTISLADTMKAYNLRWNVRKAAVSVVSNPVHNVQWVSTSPDMRMSVAGYEDPNSGRVTHVTIDVIKDVFTPKQKQDLIAKVTAAMIEVEGENMRGVTWVRVNEFESGDWAISGKALAEGKAA